MKAVFDALMSGALTDAQIAAFMIALRLKVETVEEITAAAQVMREKVTPVNAANAPHLVDTCGTGGDASHTFNISTTAALIAAAAGATVAKHGNRSITSSCGSADVLESLGVDIAIDAATMQQCLQSVGIAFLFAPSLHPAMKYAIGPRREIGVRTIFNVLGPLTNPAGAPAQLMGVFSQELVEPLAHVLKNLGSRHAFVVHGHDGMDEISLCAPTTVAELHNDHVSVHVVEPELFGLHTASIDAIRGGDPAENAQIIKEIFNGVPGPYRDAAVLNAGFSICAAGCAQSPQEGITRAQEVLDNGAAKQKLADLVAFFE
jgi:anthranilate phosphoribosyltransferase